jgi:hypothetical protein
VIYTTLNRIRSRGPCASGWGKLLYQLGKTKADDEPMPLATVLDSNGLDDCLWCFRAEPQHASIWRLLAVHYARQAQHLMKDKRSIRALGVAEKHARGEASDKELISAMWASQAATQTAFYVPSRVERSLRPAARIAAHAAEAAEWAATNDLWCAAGAALSAARTGCEGLKQAQDLRTILTYYNAEPGKEIHSWNSI